MSLACRARASVNLWVDGTVLSNFHKCNTFALHMQQYCTCHLAASFPATVCMQMSSDMPSSSLHSSASPAHTRQRIAARVCKKKRCSKDGKAQGSDQHRQERQVHRQDDSSNSRHTYDLYLLLVIRQFPPFLTNDLAHLPHSLPLLLQLLPHLTAVPHVGQEGLVGGLGLLGNLLWHQVTHHMTSHAISLTTLKAHTCTCTCTTYKNSWGQNTCKLHSVLNGKTVIYIVK